jgi:hypothetical protein
VARRNLKSVVRAASCVVRRSREPPTQTVVIYDTSAWSEIKLERYNALHAPDHRLVSQAARTFA